MGYNMHDLKNGVEELHDRIKQNQEAKGEKLANEIIYSTSEGRGLWLPLIWTGWLMLFSMTVALITTPFMDEITISSPATWIGFIVGYVVAKTWYEWGFTREHPFLSSMLACFGPGLFIMVFIDKLPLS